MLKLMRQLENLMNTNNISGKHIKILMSRNDLKTCPGGVKHDPKLVLVGLDIKCADWCGCGVRLPPSFQFSRNQNWWRACKGG